VLISSITIAGISLFGNSLLYAPAIFVTGLIVICIIWCTVTIMSKLICKVTLTGEHIVLGIATALILSTVSIIFHFSGLFQ
jgi:hypothetical protein